MKITLKSNRTCGPDDDDDYSGLDERSRNLYLGDYSYLLIATLGISMMRLLGIRSNKQDAASRMACLINVKMDSAK